MASTGPNYPSTASGWTNSGNVGADDGSFATDSIGNNSSGSILTVTGFGFSLPAGSTIDGWTVEVKRKMSSSAAMSDHTVRTVIGGTATGDNKASGTTWPTTSTTTSYGGASDKWGLTPSVGDVNASDFGVSFRAKCGFGVGGTASVDFIRIAVYYTAAGQPMVARARAVPGMRRPHGHQGW